MSAAVLAALGLASSARAQTPDPSSQTQHVMPMTSDAWAFGQDGAFDALFNHQGGPRGGTDWFVVPNWWMGTASRRAGRHQFTLNGMFSVDAGTVGRKGYREIFQAGEAYKGAPLIDYQHPHDLFMQISAVWRVAVHGTGITIAGGPSGEPALGPVAFMHRASAAGLPLAPLSHHTFDSTHVSFGVVTMAIDRGKWAVEASAFNGREPDDHRWDFDFAALDSVSGRVWFHPTEQWDIQVSTGHLHNPEELEPGDLQRTTASVSWSQTRDAAFRAFTVGYGVNAASGVNRHALFGEFTYGFGRSSLFGRVEAVQLETALFETGAIPVTSIEEARRDAVGAFTIGVNRELLAKRGWTGTLGIAASTYAVPSPLLTSHGAHPFSLQIYFRVRPPTLSMGRMWNMYMGRSMPAHSMIMPVTAGAGSDRERD